MHFPSVHARERTCASAMLSADCPSNATLQQGSYVCHVGKDLAHKTVACTYESSAAGLQLS